MNKRFNIRAIPIRQFCLVEAEYLTIALAIFAVHFDYTDSTIFQWKRAGRGDKRTALTIRNARRALRRRVIPPSPDHPKP